MSLGGKSNMTAIFPVKLRHESFVGVSNHEDAGVKGFDLLPATFMRLNADRPPTSPVVPLPFKSCEIETTHSEHIWSTEGWKKNRNEINVQAYLCYKVIHQSNSCRCRIQWRALWGGGPMCYRPLGNWRGPPAAWHGWRGSGGPCIGYLGGPVRFIIELSTWTAPWSWYMSGQNIQQLAQHKETF